jgi:hypothetical protein
MHRFFYWCVLALGLDYLDAPKMDKPACRLSLAPLFAYLAAWLGPESVGRRQRGDVHIARSVHSEEDGDPESARPGTCECEYKTSGSPGTTQQRRQYLALVRAPFVQFRRSVPFSPEWVTFVISYRPTRASKAKFNLYPPFRCSGRNFQARMHDSSFCFVLETFLLYFGQRQDLPACAKLCNTLFHS